jgi:hypothetical protein
MATNKQLPTHPDQWDEVECRQKAVERNDLTFTLVGQDLSSPETIAYWILRNIETAPEQKLRGALEKAIRMRALPNRKKAD